VIYAGTAPAALWRSEDDGATWQLNRGLWDQPARPNWSPGAGGLALHSIAPWPGDPDRLAIAISAAGVWLSEDRGLTWRTGYKGLHPEYVPEDVSEDTDALCVHNMHRAPLRPERLFMQFHGNVYRSDDAGETWDSIADGLPSGFGFWSPTPTVSRLAERFASTRRATRVPAGPREVRDFLSMRPTSPCSVRPSIATPAGSLWVFISAPPAEMSSGPRTLVEAGSRCTSGLLP